jgi:hypothetical protein
MTRRKTNLLHHVCADTRSNNPLKNRPMYAPGDNHKSLRLSGSPGASSAEKAATRKSERWPQRSLRQPALVVSCPTSLHHSTARVGIEQHDQCRTEDAACQP